MLKNSLGSIFVASLNVVNMIRKIRRKGKKKKNIRNDFSSASCALPDRFWLSVQPLKVRFLNYEILYSLLSHS